MKIAMKTIIILLISVIYLLSNNGEEHEKALFSSQVNCIEKLTSESEQLFYLSSSTLEIEWIENNEKPISQFNTRIVKPHYNNDRIVPKGKNSVFYIATNYTSLFRFISSILKKVVLMFPFHFFF